MEAIFRCAVPGEFVLNIVKLLVAAAALSSIAAATADSASNAVEPGVRAELTELVEAWIDAEVHSDPEGLEQVLHEDFLSTFASGVTLDRDAYITFIVGLDIPPFTVRNESMVQHGDTVVVIDVSDSGETKFSWIAIRRDSQWQVISQTFSKVESPDAE
jgi:hypothetical protein